MERAHLLVVKSLHRVKLPIRLSKNHLINLFFFAPSALYVNEATKPAAKNSGYPLKEMAKEGIQFTTNDSVKGAKSCIDAGFDFAEFHAAHMYFMEQFFNTTSNTRTNKCGGSIEKQGKICLENY